MSLQVQAVGEANNIVAQFHVMARLFFYVFVFVHTHSSVFLERHGGIYEFWLEKSFVW